MLPLPWLSLLECALLDSEEIISWLLAAFRLFCLKITSLSKSQCSLSVIVLHARGLYQRHLRFTATYAISADPRSSSEVINDLPDAISRLPIIWISPAVIPNLAFSASPELPLPLTVQISDYLIELARSDTGRKVLSDLNQYDIAGLEALPDDAYSNLRGLLAATNVRLLDLLP